MMSNLKKIAISCGDLNGIGLETLIKTFEDKRMFQLCIPILYANKHAFLFHSKHLEAKKIPFELINHADNAVENKLNILTTWEDEAPIEFGQENPKMAKYAIASLKRATEDTIAKYCDAIVTLPIHKEVMSGGGDFPYKGHTEYLRDVTNVEECLMFLVSDELRTGLVTNHVAISGVAKGVHQKAILTKAKLMHQSLKVDFGINQPKIAVLGLNPHAGDNGLIGKEEESIIAPALEKLKQEGIQVFGSYSADGFFGMGLHKKFDAVLAMYHDQGLLPFKLMCFDTGVNFTAGLPIVRTSPDHGTAFDIAGKGLASSNSLRNAIFTACDIAAKRELEQEANA